MKYVSTWITAALRDRKFFALDEARRAVFEKLEVLNRRPFKKRSGCRFSAFEEEERDFMRPLPATTYEPSVWSHPEVSYDYLVGDERNKYSVPYDLIGQTVDLRLTRNLVEVYYHGARVAVHVRLTAAQRDPVVKPEHCRKHIGSILTVQQAFDLLEIIEARTNHGATVFCTQYDTDGWYERINADPNQDSPLPMQHLSCSLGEVRLLRISETPFSLQMKMLAFLAFCK